MNPLRLTAFAAFAALAALGTLPLGAQVQGLRVDSRGPVAGGRAFGDAGAYEAIVGELRLLLDPNDPRNARIVDLELAPRDEGGMVEAQGDLVVLQPVDPAMRSGTALLEVSNRGGKAALLSFNRARGQGFERTAAFGDGLLMRMGLTVIWIGWQFDVPRGGDRLRLRVPTAHNADGTPIEGLVRADWTVDRPARSLALGHRDHVAYPPLDPDAGDYRLTARDGRDAERRLVPRAEWRFAADGQSIESDEGFAAGLIYELTYRARDPAVVGLGLCAVRDTIAFAKYDKACPFPVERGIAVGISQTGRFLRHFLYQGFNTTTDGRPAFDGVLVLTAGAGRGSFNHRFAQPSRDAHRYSAFFFPTDLFPFTSTLQEDPVTGRIDGLFARQHDPDHLPKVFLVNTGYEYWGRAAALCHTSVDGTRDVAPTARERIYHVAGAQHYPGAIGRGNPTDLLATYRALLSAMVEWVEDGRPPPDSRYPRIADGTLVPVARLADPGVPGLALPRAAHTAYRADYGPDWPRGIVSFEPPQLGPTFLSLVPQIDARGNEIAGVHGIELRAPLGTFTPWRLRTGLPGGNGELDDFVGQLVPFPRTDQEKARTGDPRPSLQELWGDRARYLAAARAAAAELVAERFLLAEDFEPAVDHAGRLWDFCQRPQ